jgi:hypothetical protein
VRARATAAAQAAARGLDVSAVEPVVGPLPEFPPPYLQLQVKLVWSYILFCTCMMCVLACWASSFVSREVTGTGKAARQCVGAARGLDVSAVWSQWLGHCRSSLRPTCS